MSVKEGKRGESAREQPFPAVCTGTRPTVPTPPSPWRHCVKPTTIRRAS